jgi:hypothetical protein
MSEPGGIIYYHQERRGSRIIPLQSYDNPPPESKFDGLDYFDFQLKDVSDSIIDYLSFLSSLFNFLSVCCTSN